MKSLIWFLASVSYCFATPVPPYLHFDDDAIRPEDFKVWKERLHRLQEAVVLHYDPKHMSLVYGEYDDHDVVLKYRQLFDEFVSLFERSYNDDTKESDKRFQIFMESLQRQQFFNRREAAVNGTATYGVNKFSDWTPAEFQGLLRNHGNESPSYAKPIQQMQLRSPLHLQSCSYYVEPYPQSVDWRSKVTRVKNQGACGSCWAFVGSEQVESYWAIRTGHVVERSPQQLLSCSPSLGCEGGNTCAALEWLRKMQMVLATENDYPYEGKDTACHSVNSTSYGPMIQAVCGCKSLAGSESTMLRVVHQKGPLSVNVDAVQWHDYTGGIIQHHCTNKNMNHAVQIVGYDLSSGPVPYWLAKNQWGTSFGENGFVRVKYGDNMCGIAEQPSFIAV